ncbi:MAG: hypothetical protein ACI81V_000263 [Lentimonas sp.]
MLQDQNLDIRSLQSVFLFLRGVGIVVLLTVWPLVAGADEQLFSLDNAYFEIVGTDSRSVSYVQELSLQVVEQMEPYLNYRTNNFPQRILVALRPDAFADFEGNYSIRVAAQGFVSLDLKWEADLDLSTLCYALVDAYLQRYSIYHFGPAAGQTMSVWPARAIGQHCYLSLRPAESVTFHGMLESDSAVPFESLVELQANSSASARALERWESYAVLLFLKQSGMPRASLCNFIEAQLRGADLPEVLMRQFPGIERSGLAAWWQVQRSQISVNNNEWCERMERSRAWLEEMSQFDSYREAGFELKNLRGIWSQRHEPALREILSARLELVKLRLTRVNPVYFNAARALAVLFDTVLSEAAPKYTFIHAFSEYLTAFEDAKILERRTQAALEVR